MEREELEKKRKIYHHMQITFDVSVTNQVLASMSQNPAHILRGPICVT